MWSKILKAAINGNLIRKTLVYIFKLPKKFFKWISAQEGNIARFIIAHTTKVDEKQIMLISFQGDYTCNPKYIAEEIRRRKLKYKIVCSARKASLTNGTFPGEFSLVEQYSSDYYAAIAKSKLIVSNSVEFLKKPMPIKKDQVIIETWHGSLGIKRFGENDNKGKAWVNAGKKCGKLAAYIISNSQFEDDVYRDTFWKETPILRYGHPRNDILFRNDEKFIETIRRSVLGRIENYGEYRYVLYAPTFRDDHGLDCYNLDFDRLLHTLSEKYGQKWKVLLRLHPTIRRQAKQFRKGNSNFIDVTAYPDIQEIMLISDIAITDYSSWIYDFVMTRKPGFIFATDIDRYNHERGFYYPLEDTPFPIARNNADLNEAILAFDYEEYRNKAEEFLAGKGCVEDGQAAGRVVDQIQKIMG